MPVIIRVEVPPTSYNITIAPGELSRIGSYMADLPVGNKVLLVSNPNIFKHWGDRVIQSLQKSGFVTQTCILPAGERYKTLASIQKIYSAALENRLERSSTILAFGGGVIGDMAGFAAATWLRGINFIQVPTSLLAMVDAAIGGKTGINHPQGKNLIGAFHQPKLVLIDPEVLQTLPKREFKAAMAEVIKYGVIWDAELFYELEALDRLDTLPTEALQLALQHSCQAKAAVVSQDEREAGLRAILNYGHTIGHAVESLTGYRSINHGEAVAIGMAAAGAIAVNLNLWQASSQHRQLELIRKAGLPSQLPEKLDIEEIIMALQTDKKVKNGRIRFVLPTEIGAAMVSDQVTSDLIRQVLHTLSNKVAV